MERAVRQNKYAGAVLALLVVALLVATMLTGCATISGTALTSEQMAAQGIDEMAMRRGRAIAVTSCAECHRFYWPREYSPEEWPGIARDMGGQASLSKAQIANLELYLVESSRTTRERQ